MSPLLTAAAQDNPALRDRYLRQEEAINAATDRYAEWRGRPAQPGDALIVRLMIAKFVEVTSEPARAPYTIAAATAQTDRLARELFQAWTDTHAALCGCTMQYLDDCSHKPPIALREWLREHAPHAGELLGDPTVHADDMRVAKSSLGADAA